MRFLLDTCALSELTKPAPNASVAQWFAQQDELALYVPSLALGELKRGIERLDDGQRKRYLQNWLATHVVRRFADRVLPLSAEVALRWGALQAGLESQGKPLATIDGLIAATALHHNLTVVTRNTRDMEASGATLLNPWV